MKGEKIPVGIQAFYAFYVSAILIGTALSIVVSPWWAIVPVGMIIGALVFSGVAFVKAATYDPYG